MRASKAFEWWWYGWGGKPRRRTTGSVQTTQTFSDGSKVTTKTSSYNRGPSTIKTTRNYRLPDGSRRTESTTTTKDSPTVVVVGVVFIVALLIGWPWAFHWRLWLEILISCLWYPVLLVLAIATITSLGRRKWRKEEPISITCTRTPEAAAEAQQRASQAAAEKAAAKQARQEKRAAWKALTPEARKVAKREQHDRNLIAIADKGWKSGMVLTPKGKKRVEKLRAEAAPEE